MIQSWPLAEAPFGVSVRVDSRRPPDTAEAGELRRLMQAHGLLVLRGEALSVERHRDLMACFGRLVRSDGAPKELYVSNRRQSSAPDGELIFHYDYTYDRNPTEFISLYGFDVVPGVTPTRFASSARVLHHLPAALTARLAGLTALHSCFHDRAMPAAERAAIADDARRRGAPGWNVQDWKCSHPLVWQNKAGVRSLYACIQHTVRILELAIGESDLLLEELFGHLYAPANVYEHRWEMHDLVIWDNRTVQHCRPKPNDLPRTLRRLEVLDEDINDLYIAIGRANGFL